MLLPINKRGFTLIELLVVIAIIGLLASMVLISLNTAREKARDVNRITTIGQVNLAMELYYDEYGHYPIPSMTDPTIYTTTRYILVKTFQVTRLC